MGGYIPLVKKFFDLFGKLELCAFLGVLGKADGLYNTLRVLVKSRRSDLSLRTMT